MNNRLVSYLQDNRDYIIENWITESDLPPPNLNNNTEGTVPVAFLEGLFERIIERLQGSGQRCHCQPEERKVEMRDLLGVTCACQANRLRGHVCLELHESGIRAFMSIFNDSWDAKNEFNELDRETYMRMVNESMACIFGQEIFRCPNRAEKESCPFHLN